MLAMCEANGYIQWRESMNASKDRKKERKAFNGIRYTGINLAGQAGAIA
jgi:hypothetical protein